MTLEMSGLYMNKDKRNFTKALYSKWQNCFPLGYKLSILKSLYLYFRIELPMAEEAGLKRLPITRPSVEVGGYTQAKWEG